jgi:hypothetical protein
MDWQAVAGQDCFAGFTLTDAVRPSPVGTVIPRQGYRLGLFRDPSSRRKIPMLVAAVSSERLFSVFMDLVEPLGPVVDVILETSHESTDAGHEDLVREGIDLPVLLSHFHDHEDLLLNDGCTGVAVLDEQGASEVQFDEHKLLVVYAQDLRPFEKILRDHGVRRDDRLRVISEADHLHSTHPRYYDEFEQLCYRLGIDEVVEPVRW